MRTESAMCPESRKVDSMQDRGKTSSREATSATPAKSDAGSPRLTFLVLIEEVEPRFKNGKGGPGPIYNANGAWDPPKTRQDFVHVKSYLFRWDNFKFTQLDSGAVDPNVLQNHRYSTASVFTQSPKTDLLLAVRGSVRLLERFGPWHNLQFIHQKQDGTANSYYSLLDFAGNDRTAAKMSANCAPELLPECYNPRDPKVGRVHAGLAGKLPLLISLAAFSAEQRRLVDVLASIRAGPWRNHNRKPSGRHDKFRGMVVTVFPDPQNPMPREEQKKKLKKLEDGDYGAFYKP